MPLPVLAPPSTTLAGEQTLSRTVAGARLELHRAHVDKMVRAGMLPVPITSASVDQLAGRPYLDVVAGELTVLRTDARHAPDPVRHGNDHRKWLGFHVDHTDAECAAACLGWWRSDPERVLDNGLFVVTLATFPAAVYLITGHEEHTYRVGEEHARHRYAGTLLARVSAAMHISYRDPLRTDLLPLVRQIMDSRISVDSGGPIGYLGPSSTSKSE